MEKEFQKAEKLINKILKRLGDATLEWTLQISKNTANPGHISYSCMIEVSDRLQPITWVCDSWEDLFEHLDKAGKELNRDMVDVAYMQGEIARCDRLKAYYSERIEEMMNHS